MAATYTKLRSGNWGLRSTMPLRPGDVAVVVKRSGQARRCVVGRVLWTGEDGTCIATIADVASRRAPAAPRSAPRVVEPEPDYTPANDDAGDRFADEWEGVGS